MAYTTEAIALGNTCQCWELAMSDYEDDLLLEVMDYEDDDFIDDGFEL
jgi:hypothetical protein